MRLTKVSAICQSMALALLVFVFGTAYRDGTGRRDHLSEDGPDRAIPDDG